jgi:hypothetical protein
MTMLKVQVFLREDQKAALKSLAARTGERQSDLIRRSVDLLLDRSKEDDAAWREATRQAAGIWKDRTDLDEAARDFREGAKRRFASTYEQT